jgi:hypothetical protein
MLQKSALYFKGADTITGALDDIIGPADKTIISVFVSPCVIAV